LCLFIFSSFDYLKPPTEVEVLSWGFYWLKVSGGKTISKQEKEQDIISE
jgi:hypothetical protein